jgi:hypothetical protein
VKGAVGETAAGKDRINIRHAERQASLALRDASFKRGDAFAEIG